MRKLSQEEESLKVIKKEIEDVVRNLAYKLERIILFGSRARGDHKKESDWDILVVVRDDLTPKKMKELWFAIYSSLHRRMKFSSFDVIVKTKRIYENEKLVVNTISNEAYMEGVNL